MKDTKVLIGIIVATIILLVGGVGAGIILIGQNQDINEKAASNTFKPPCTAGGCSTDNYPEDWVNHYRCLGVKEMGQNCNDIKVATAVESASFQFNCGTEQIDYWDGSANNSTGFTSMFYDQPCESGGGGGGGALVLPKMNEAMTSGTFSIESYHGFWDQSGQFHNDPAGSDLNQTRASFGAAYRLAPRWQAYATGSWVKNKNRFSDEAVSTLRY